MSSAAVLLPGFVGTELPEWLASRLRAGLAGVCLFGENIQSREQLRALTDAIRAANPRALIAIDEEGGDVTRLYYDEGSPYPGNALLGRIDDPGLTAEVAATVARELRSVGVNLNFAPDADINSSPDNPVIGVRSFGDDPELVSNHVGAWVAAHEAEGVAVSAKHFPGHGDTTQDSHHDLPAIDVSVAELRDRELRPFVAAVQVGARSIMSSHIVVRGIDPDAPATFSEPILGGLLRGELEFDGVIVSDALDMAGASGLIGIPAAAVRALAAGCDLLCIGTRNTDVQLGEISAAIDAAVADGTLPAARLRTLPTASRAWPPRSPSPPRSTRRRIRRSMSTVRSTPSPSETASSSTRTPTSSSWRRWPTWRSAPLLGPAAAGADTVPVFEGDGLPQLDGQLIIVGKDNHRRAWTRELIDMVRVDRPTAIIVDMGWPSADRAYADVARRTSRFAGEALVTWLEREAWSESESTSEEPRRCRRDRARRLARVHPPAADRLRCGMVLETAVAAVTELARIYEAVDQFFLVDQHQRSRRHRQRVGPGRHHGQPRPLRPRVRCRSWGRQLGRAVRIDDDAHAAALRRLPPAREGARAHSMAYLNLGTSLAAGLVLAMRLWRRLFAVSPTRSGTCRWTGLDRLSPGAVGAGSLEPDGLPIRPSGRDSTDR